MNTFLMISGFTIFGINIKFYGILMALAMLVGVLLACKNAKQRGFSGDDIIVLACYVLPFAIVYARLYYVVFSLDKYTNFWDIFKIWEGGLAIYGGVIGGAIGMGIYCAIHRKNFFSLADVVVPSLILGQAIGRWGNFFNQEAYGYEVTNSSLQWFPFSVYIESSGTWHLATFFYESMWNLIVFAILMLVLYKKKGLQKGVVMALYFVLYGTGRVFIEGLRTDSLYLGGIRVSQLLSGLLIVFGLVYIVIVFALENKKKRIILQEKPVQKVKQTPAVTDDSLSNDDILKKGQENDTKEQDGKDRG